MNGLLLDTHIWIWYAEGIPALLSPDQIRQIEQERSHGRLYVSVVSAWEIGLLLARNRITLSVPLKHWVRMAAALPGLQMRTLTGDVAVESTILPGNPHADPADRFLIAEARLGGLDLVTADRRIIEYAHRGHVRVMAA